MDSHTISSQSLNSSLTSNKSVNYFCPQCGVNLRSIQLYCSNCDCKLQSIDNSYKRIGAINLLIFGLVLIIVSFFISYSSEASSVGDYIEYFIIFCGVILSIIGSSILKKTDLITDVLTEELHRKEKQHSANLFLIIIASIYAFYFVKTSNELYNNLFNTSNYTQLLKDTFIGTKFLAVTFSWIAIVVLFRLSINKFAEIFKNIKRQIVIYSLGLILFMIVFTI